MVGDWKPSGSGIFAITFRGRRYVLTGRKDRGGGRSAAPYPDGGWRFSLCPDGSAESRTGSPSRRWGTRNHAEPLRLVYRISGFTERTGIVFGSG